MKANFVSSLLHLDLIDYGVEDDIQWEILESIVSGKTK